MTKAETGVHADAERLLAGGSKSFFAASRGLPAKVRTPAAILYAYCRLADDAVDEAGAGEVGAAVAELTARLDAIYAGSPRQEGFDPAFAEVVERFGIPKTLPAALIEGFAWDAEGRRYATLSDVRAYGARVAGAVGAMMALVLGTRDRHSLARATDLGVAMQLTNIARDVGEDAGNGRLYLPLEWLEESGLDVERWLTQPEWNPAIGEAVARLLAEAERLYARADAGIDALPVGVRPGIYSARRLYAGIGEELMRGGLNPVVERTVVPRARKRQLLTHAALSSLRSLVVPRDPSAWPALPETAYLVDAAAKASEEAAPSWWRVGPRIAATLEMFETLERRDRVTRATPGP